MPQTPHWAAERAHHSAFTPGIHPNRLSVLFIVHTITGTSKSVTFCRSFRYLSHLCTLYFWHYGPRIRRSRSYFCYFCRTALTAWIIPPSLKYSYTVHRSRSLLGEFALITFSPENACAFYLLFLLRFASVVRFSINAALLYRPFIDKCKVLFLTSSRRSKIQVLFTMLCRRRQLPSHSTFSRQMCAAHFPN